MHFLLPQDAEGWPPAACETLWVTPKEENRFIVKNVPFFVQYLALDDEVEGEVDEHNKVAFKKVLAPSGNSTIRIIYKSKEIGDLLTMQLEKIGCFVESCPQYGLLAVNIPPEHFKPSMKLVHSGIDRGDWVYEEACLPSTSVR